MTKANKLLVSLLSFSFALSLGACSNKLPTTPYEKVKFAFNGVEKSFKSPRVSNNRSSLAASRNKIGGSNPQSGLETIFNLYTNEDKRDDFLDDVSYNQPPMVQFQYIKKVLGKIGSGYEFNKKYYDTITGEMYLDIESGHKKEGEQYKYNYTFVLGMSINIDDNDLITADVSFDINIKKGNESYTTKWYVGIELDYDMANNSPNYTMAMVTENNEKELPYYGHYTYEYDYVEVKNNSINEWRKFCMDNDHRLVKDNAHQNFQSYIDEGCVYKVDACSWYRNGVYYKNKTVRETGHNAETIAEALFSDLGLNTNEINADAFFNQTGEVNSKIKESYNDFSKIAKEDIIYDLMCREDDQGQQKQIVGIRAMNGSLSGGASNYLIPSSVTVREIFNGFFDGNGEKQVIVLYYVDQNDGLVSEIRDLSSLRFFVREQNNQEAIEVELTETLYDIMVRGKFASRWLYVAFMDNQGIGGLMDFIYSGDLPDTYVKPTFPSVLANLGVPEYDGNRITYGTQQLSNEPYVLEIANTDGNEAEAYKRKLSSSGFTIDAEYYGSYKGLYYRKDVGDNYLYVNFDDSDISLGVVVIRIFHASKPETHDDTEINSISMIGDFNDWDTSSGGLIFTKSGDNIYRLNYVRVEANTKFKFVVNNEWGERGGYGYSDIDNAPIYDKYLEVGDYNNVVVKDQILVLSFEAIVQEQGIIFNITALEVQQPK